jgi:hypothetical protein
MSNREFHRVMNPLVAKIIKVLNTQMTDEQLKWMDGGTVNIGFNSNNGMGLGFEHKINNSGDFIDFEEV